MSNDPGTLEQFARAIAGLFSPLKQRVEEGDILSLMAELGIQFPDSLASNPAFSGALSNVAVTAGNMPQLLTALTQAIQAEDYGTATQKVVELLSSFQRLITDFQTVSSAIDAQKNSIPGLTPAEVGNFASDLPVRLVEYLVISQIENTLVPVASGLDFIGVFERTAKNVGSANPLKPPFTERKLNLGNFTAFLKSPSDLLESLYGWGAATFDGKALLQKLEKLALELGLPAVYTEVGTPTLDLMFLEIQPKTDISPRGLVFRLASVLKGAKTFNFDQERWGLEFGTDVQLPVNALLTLQSNGDFSLKSSSEQISGEAFVRFITKPDPTTGVFILLGEADKSRLEFKEFTAESKVRLTWNTASHEAGGDFSVGADIKGGQLVIDLSGSDGFISKIVPSGGFSAQFEVGMGISTSEGFYFRGSSVLEIKIPVHIDLAIIEIPSLTLGAGIKDGKFPVTLCADIKANLGPLKAVVENMGIKATFDFPGDNTGNLGPVDLAFGFKPPNGVGLSLDAGVVKGGGYLYFDFDREEYAGALELVFSEWIALKAIGLITTKMPDGSKGFSLLVIITVEFGSGIQLGFGFTLLGVGGLLGLNRTVNIDPLKEGIRTGAVESVMFPQDVIANAPRIISDLRRFFPPEKDIFLVGPMAKIGWGTPTLVSVSLGVILEFPSVNITILGVLKVILPDEKADILRLQVNFIGRLEPSNQLLWFYAELFDSRVLFITLEGGMGLLVNWGDNANFVVSVGGFHPRYSPPPLPFPAPPRIAANILNESWARIRIEGYFAVTSNSVQFGARAELYFGVSAFNLDGHLGFDALFQFNPFFFSFSLSFSLSVKVFGIGLFSVGFSGLLEGPTPWHIKGKGKISLFFFSISVPFEHTWGGSQETALDPIEVFPLLEKEFNALTNWEAVLPKSSSLLVSLRQLGEADTKQLVLHPVGKLRISQRKIPLDFKLDKVGNQRPSDVQRVSVDAAIPGGSLSISEIEEKFAIGQFKELGDADRLSSPGFEHMESGLEVAVAGEQMKTSQGVKRVIRYETVIIDNNFKFELISFFMFFRTGFTTLYNYLFDHFLKGSAVSKSVLSQQHKKRMQPFEDVIHIQPNQYSVVFNSNNRPVDVDATAFSSQAKAMEYMQQQIQSDPNLANNVHVIPNSEVNLAA